MFEILVLINLAQFYLFIYIYIYIYIYTHIYMYKCIYIHDTCTYKTNYFVIPAFSEKYIHVHVANINLDHLHSLFNKK